MIAIIILLAIIASALLFGSTATLIILGISGAALAIYWLVEWVRDIQDTRRRLYEDRPHWVSPELSTVARFVLLPAIFGALYVLPFLLAR